MLFQADNFAYYKNDKTRELDSTIGDLKFKILDLEARAIRQLVEMVLGRQQHLRSMGSGAPECVRFHSRHQLHALPPLLVCVQAPPSTSSTPSLAWW